MGLAWENESQTKKDSIFVEGQVKKLINKIKKTLLQEMAKEWGFKGERTVLGQEKRSKKSCGCSEINKR